MGVKAPTFSGMRGGLQTGAGILDGEIIAEMAAAIGRSGRALEKALDDLREHDAGAEPVRDDPCRQALVQEAADCAWALFTQYELAGLSSQAQLVKRYRVPGEVLVRVGIR